MVKPNGRWLVAAVIVCVVGSSGARAATFENPILGYTHLLPSPYTLPAGKIVLGTDVAFGITDFLQIGTSALYDILQVYNANVRISVLDFPGFSFALTGGIESYNLQNIDSSNPSVQVTSYLPGAVAGVALTRDFGLLVGGNLNFSSQTVNLNGLATSAYTHGASAESDVSWAAVSNKGWPVLVLSGGVSYDFTYQLAGVGASVHFKGFHLGAHYYPAATDYKVVPILAGGAAVDF